MKALVKPSTKPYSEIMIENSWGRWIRNHVQDMINAGWTLIEDYTPEPEPEPNI